MIYIFLLFSSQIVMNEGKNEESCTFIHLLLRAWKTNFHHFLGIALRTQTLVLKTYLSVLGKSLNELVSISRTSVHLCLLCTVTRQSGFVLVSVVRLCHKMGADRKFRSKGKQQKNVSSKKKNVYRNSDLLGKGLCTFWWAFWDWRLERQLLSSTN